jgi:hypothetical protein
MSEALSDWGNALAVLFNRVPLPLAQYEVLIASGFYPLRKLGYSQFIMNCRQFGGSASDF